MRPDFGERARAFVGTRFRPQGRDPSLGLDCVGLLLCTFGIPIESVRRNYLLRGDHRAEIERELTANFRRVRSAKRTGDLMLLSIASDQLHFGIRTDRGFVHAHAGLGRVVETPGEPPWRVLAIYRKRMG
jgi:lipoprotein Spr